MKYVYTHMHMYKFIIFHILILDALWLFCTWCHPRLAKFCCNCCFALSLSVYPSIHQCSEWCSGQQIESSGSLHIFAHQKLEQRHSGWAGSWCTYRGDEASVPLQHHVDALHHAQQVKEAAAGERRGWFISHRNTQDGNSLGRTSRRLFSRQTGNPCCIFVNTNTWVGQSPWCVSGGGRFWSY